MMAIKTVVAGASGEGLEIYDFLVFSFFAIYIARAFFPKQGPMQSLLLTVATLGLGSHQAINALGRLAGRSYYRAEGRSFDRYLPRCNVGRPHRCILMGASRIARQPVD